MYLFGQEQKQRQNVRSQITNQVGCVTIEDMKEKKYQVRSFNEAKAYNSKHLCSELKLEENDTSSERFSENNYNFHEIYCLNSPPYWPNILHKSAHLSLTLTNLN